MDKFGYVYIMTNKNKILISKKNPEWSELVTENGFVSRQIPHCVRDDNSQCG